MIDRREGALRERAPSSPRCAQHVERLRGRHLVDQVQADEELRLPARQRADRVRVPDF